MPDFYYYPRCGTCRKAIKWLDEHHIQYTPHDLVKNPPSAAQLENDSLIQVVNIIGNKD